MYDCARRYLLALIASGLVASLGGSLPQVQAAEERQVIELEPGDREHCLARMRMYMDVNNTILRATLEGDMERVRRAALSAVPPAHRAPDLRGEVPPRAAAQGRGGGPRGGGDGAWRQRGGAGSSADAGRGGCPGQGDCPRRGGRRAGAGQDAEAGSGSPHGQGGGKRQRERAPERAGRMASILPEPYQEMMHGQHEAYQEIARDAEALGNPGHIQEQLTRIQDTCIACHSAYRFSRR